MTNTLALEQLIQDKGLKKTFIAGKLDLSLQGFQNKVDNLREFKASEMFIIADILGISTYSQMRGLFFAPYVDGESTNGQ